MANKPPVTTFDVDWAKIRSWANQQKIPTVAVNNVLALDNSRLQNGYNTMSNAERTRAILAASGMNYNTALPTDTPGPSDVVGNTIRNAQSIFTGLMPTRLFSNIWGTLKTTVKDIEHPQQAGGLGKILENTALSWLPGAYDFGQVIQAHGLEKGLEDLAQQPITSILDVMPFLAGGNAAVGALASTGRLDDAAIAASTRTAPRIAAKLNVPDISSESTAISEALSKRLGVEPKAIARMGAVRMAGKGIGSIKIGTQTKMYTGMAAPGVPTIGQRMANMAEKSGLGKTLSTAAHTLAQLRAKYSADYRERRKVLSQKVADLTPDEYDKSTGMVTKEGEKSEFNRELHLGRGPNEILDDPTVSPKVKEAVKAYRDWLEWHQDLMLKTKRLLPMPIIEQDGTITVAYYRPQDIAALEPLRIQYEDALRRADALSQKGDRAVAMGAQMDEAFAPIMRDMAAAKDQITTAVAGTTGKIPADLGRIIGTGGYLDKMAGAAQKGDWKTFTSESKKARNALGKIQQPGLEHLQGSIQTALTHGQLRKDLEKAARDGYSPTVQRINQKALEAQYTFLREATMRAPEYRDAIWNIYQGNLLDSDRREATLDAAAQKLTGQGYDKTAVDQLRRSNPQRLYEIAAVGGDQMFRDPFLPNMTPQDHAHFLNDAIKNVTMMRSMGERPMWVPTLSGEQAESPIIQGEQVFVNPAKYPTVHSTMAKAMDASRTVNDVMLGVNRATQEILGRHAAIDFVSQIVVPMMSTREELEAGVNQEQAGRARMVGHTTFAPGAVADAMIANHFGMSRFNVKPLLDEEGKVAQPSDLQEATGLTAEELGLDPTKEYYIPTSFKKQLPKLVGDQFPLHGAWDKTTGVFKWSILALSPRYTAHVLFGGGMLLALAIDPRSFLLVKDAAKMVNAYHKANLDPSVSPVLFQGATPRGSPEQDYHFAGGDKALKLLVQDRLARMGLNPKLAKGIDIVKAAGDLNFRFTNYISDMQRSIAYLDGIKQAKGRRYFYDEQTGERRLMDDSRLQFEGLQAAERVMGNLQAMTPLERSVARKIMPFYGWTKHILQYVMRFPTDHPWRVMFLSTLATQNSDNFASGLDERLQLLLFLGQPDVNGNVTGIDVRAMNPFRDVANYATLQGWLSALNPILTAPVTAIDPQIIFGSNQLYPSVTYNSFYGTNVAGPAGSPMTIAQQFVPEFGALDYALGLSAQARAVKRQGGSAQLKDMLASLGIPWTPQQLNLQQISAKHEIDRYNQAKTDALNAWQTGDFSTIDKYPADAQLPDPLGSTYNITPAELKAQYNAAKKRFPKLAPSESTPNLPAARL